MKKRKFPRPIPLLQKIISPPKPQPLRIPYHPPPKPHHEYSQSLFPTLSLSQTTDHNKFLKFLETHLKPPLTPQALLSFLNTKLRHSSSFAHYDYHLFTWAPRADDTFRHDHSTVEWMARSLAATDRFSPLSDLLSSAATHPCPCADRGIFSCPRTEPIFAVAINAFCRVGRLDDAVAAFDSLTRLIDGKPSAAVCNAVIGAFVKRHRLADALNFYSRMVERERVVPDTFTFNTLLSGYCRSRQMGSALELFREMRVRGCTPNVVSFNTLIGGFFRERRFDEGLAAAREMLELGIRFSAATCEILVGGLCREGRAHEAREVLVGFARKGAVPGGYDYSGLVGALPPETGSELVEEMWSMGNPPSLIAGTTVIEGLRRSGRIDGALGLAERMTGDGLVPDSLTFDCLVGDLCRAGRTAGADGLRLLASSKGFAAGPVAYHSIVAGYAREGKRKEGEKLVDEMLDLGFIPDIVSYNRLMDGLAKSTPPSRSRGLGDVVNLE